MKVQGGSGGIDAPILNVGIRWNRVVKLPPERNLGTHLRVGWGGITDSLDVSEKRTILSPRWIRHSDSQTRILATNRITTERFVN